ncbi:PfkB family carbohydrate kinase [Candidatus Margulisiibacteriota bacterium]
MRKRFSVLAFGEVLFDCFPDYTVMGGAPFNFSFHIHKLKHSVNLLTRIGDDDNGKKVQTFFKKHKLDTSLLEVDPRYPTGTVQVDMSDPHSPQFTIEMQVAWDYIVLPSKKKLPKKIDLVYFGSLAQRSDVSLDAIHTLLKQLNSSTLVLFDINLRQHYYTKELIDYSLQFCDILKINSDELVILKEMYQSTLSDEAFIDWLREQFTIQWLCVTRGKDGSSLYSTEPVVHATVPKDVTVVDAVGAGDAYAAVLALGVLYEWKPDVIIERATRFSSIICGVEGAVPLTDNFYMHYKEWR